MGKRSGRGKGGPSGSAKGGEAGGKGDDPGGGKTGGRRAVKAPLRLETVFTRVDEESIRMLKADAARALGPSAGTLDAGGGARLLPYPCSPEGSERPVIGIPLRPRWTEDMGVDALNAHETDTFHAWLSGIYKSYKVDELNYFEHNLEVWRQVWRTAFERADIVVMVLDARIPLFHFSEAVFRHLKEELGKDVVILLNKADIVPPASIELWSAFFADHCPGVPLLPFSVPKSGSGRVDQLPCVVEFLDALKSCHVSRGGERIPAAPFFDGAREANPAATSERIPEEFITVVLQGDPNMGKSSVINAVFGQKLVSSSATPGHTKHFQTLFLSRGVCFCDSPGIVCPKLDVPKPLQVIFGSYRIAQVREPYHIIRFIAERCHPPLPQLLKLAAFRDKDAEPHEPWSPLDVCEAYARKRGFFRRGGRPDPHRAANRLMNDALNAVGDLALCFAPPGVDAAAVRAAAAAAPPQPAWMVPRAASDDEGELDEPGGHGAVQDEEALVEASGEEEEDGEVDARAEGPAVVKARNAFAALDSSESGSDDSER